MYLSPQEVAERLGVHPETVRRLVARGDLPALRVGRALRIAESALEALAVVPRASAASPARPRARPSRGRYARLVAELDGSRPGRDVGSGP